MVKAIQIDSNGNEVGGTERWFTDSHFANMEQSRGVYLRWRKVEDKPLKKQTKTKIHTQDEKTDFPFTDGGSDAAVDDERTDGTDEPGGDDNTGHPDES